MKAKKSLGQNFLKSASALRAIVEAGDISKNDVILEIGPGKGALTEKLLTEVSLKKAKYVLAVEKDVVLLNLLRDTFSKEIKNGTLFLHEGDILEFDIEKCIGDTTYKIIANIPYNITGAILKKFLTAKHQPREMVLMVQHEVAKRILARDGKESILSVSVKAYGEPKMIMKVPARYFSPSPKVDSAVISIKNISRRNFTTLASDITDALPASEEKFWKIIHAGFAHKRKKLSSNLKSVLIDNKDLLRELGNKRAEELSLTEWSSIASKC